MDLIDYTMQQEQYLTEKEEIKKQTWEDFECAVSRKKLFLFGTGAGAGCFFRRYKNRYRITGIVDNGEQWHGFKAGDILTEAFESINEEVKILPVDVLRNYGKEEIVVLITSTKYYNEMGRQLSDMGIKEQHVLLMMEANRRKQHPEIYEASEYNVDFNVQMKEYARVCCEKPIQGNKIVFRSFDTYSDHGKYITEQLLKRSNKLDIVWILKDLKEEVPEGVRTVWTGNWKKYTYEMETAKVWVINTLMPPHIIKGNPRSISTQNTGQVSL